MNWVETPKLSHCLGIDRQLVIVLVGVIEIAAGLVMPLWGSIAGERGLGTGGGLGAGRGHD